MIVQNNVLGPRRRSPVYMFFDIRAFSVFRCESDEVLICGEALVECFVQTGANRSGPDVAGSVESGVGETVLQRGDEEIPVLWMRGDGWLEGEGE